MVLGNLYENNGSYTKPDWQRVTMPIWAWILIILACLIPIINLIGVVALIAMSIAMHEEDDMAVKGPIGKLIDFLTRKV